MLNNKNRIIYGEGGVAWAFARDGADVILAGRTRKFLA